MDFKNMTDSELASIMVNYINRIEHLMRMISGYIDRSIIDISIERIKAEYRQLKYELREDAKYLDQIRNKNGSILYKSAFMPSIREANAFGFTVPVNATVNWQMFSAVEEAHYKLTKYCSLKKWESMI